MGNCWCQDCCDPSCCCCDHGECCGQPLFEQPLQRPDATALMKGQRGKSQRRRYLLSLVGTTTIRDGLVAGLGIPSLVRLVEEYADCPTVFRNSLDVYAYLQQSVYHHTPGREYDRLGDLFLIEEYLHRELDGPTLKQVQNVMTRWGREQLPTAILYYKLSFDLTPTAMALRQHYIKVMEHPPCLALDRVLHVGGSVSVFDNLDLVCHRCGSADVNRQYHNYDIKDYSQATGRLTRYSTTTCRFCRYVRHHDIYDIPTKGDNDMQLMVVVMCNN